MLHSATTHTVADRIPVVLRCFVVDFCAQRTSADLPSRIVLQSSSAAPSSTPRLQQTYTDFPSRIVVQSSSAAPSSTPRLQQTSADLLSRIVLQSPSASQ